MSGFYFFTTNPNSALLTNMTVMTPTMTMCSTLGPTDSTPMTATDTPTTANAGAAAKGIGEEAMASSASSTPCSRSGRPTGTSVADARSSNNSNSNNSPPTVKANVKYRGEEGRRAVLSTCREVLYDYGVLCSVVIVELHSAADVDVLAAHPDVAWVDVDAQVSFIAPMNTGMR